MKTLRIQTHAAHMDVENTIDIAQKIKSLDTYKHLIEKFYGFYKPIETSLQKIQENVDDRLMLSQRVKSPWLYQDLVSLGYSEDEIEGISLDDQWADLSTPSKLLGCLYVLEGSSLGGQLISKILQEETTITPECGGRFFQGYGPETAYMWRRFGDVVCDHADRKETQNEIIASANQTFAHFKGWIA